MDERVLKSLILPIDDGQGNVDDVKYLIPQGTVTEADLEEVEGTKADAIVRSASGNIASYDDGGDLPMKSLKVNIVPKQSGSGDPSPDNVRPISGTDEVGIVVDGKNILSDEVQHLAIDGATGKLLLNNARCALVVPYPKAGTKYTISRSAVGSSSYYYYGFYTALTDEQSPIDYHDMGTTTSYTVTAPEGAKYLVIFYGAALSPNPQVEVGETATDYVPYNPNSDTKSITLPQTVYGGTLDVVNGKLVKFPYYSSYNGETLSGEWICDRAVYSQGTTPPIGSQVVDMSGTGVEIDLTPTEVKSLLGDNNVWSDSGSVEVEYRADTSIVINKILEALA